MANPLDQVASWPATAAAGVAAAGATETAGPAGHPFAWASVTKLLVALAAPGVLPGFGYQPHCDWGLGFEIRDRKAPHWTGSRNSPRTFGHFGQSGSFLWVDPEARVACASLADRDFGDWAK